MPQKKRATPAPPARVAPALVTPPLGPLCEDTREQLWSCISSDLLVVRAAACLNREWRVAAVEHGSPLKLSSGLTLDLLASSEFQNVMRFDARDSSLTDERTSVGSAKACCRHSPGLTQVAASTLRLSA